MGGVSFGWLALFVIFQSSILTYSTRLMHERLRTLYETQKCPPTSWSRMRHGALTFSASRNALRVLFL